MSLQQYNMSNLLKQKCSLTKLREGLEERKGKLCYNCKRFRYLGQNCKSKEEEKRGKAVPQNKFEVLSSQVMQCGVKERTIRKQEEVREVECFKCKEEGHKYKECPRRKEEKMRQTEEVVVYVVIPQKVQQKEKE